MAPVAEAGRPGDGVDGLRCQQYLLVIRNQEAIVLGRFLSAGFSVLTLCAAMAAAEANAKTTQAKPSHDVVAFCRMHGTSDYPEKIFFGPSYKNGMLPKLVEDTGATKWRCMEGGVFVCMDSASGDWCSKKDPSRQPDSDIKSFCAANPGSNFVTDAVEVYSASQWRCNGSRPVIKMTWALDERGFMQKMWPRLVVRNGVAVAPHPDDFGMR